jgi:hypothetical protein
MGQASALSATAHGVPVSFNKLDAIHFLGPLRRVMGFAAKSSFIQMDRKACRSFGSQLMWIDLEAPGRPLNGASERLLISAFVGSPSRSTRTIRPPSDSIPFSKAESALQNYPGAIPRLVKNPHCLAQNTISAKRRFHD